MKSIQHNISGLNAQSIDGCNLIPYSNRNDYEFVS
jgi:hypothetical protein